MFPIYFNHISALISIFLISILKGYVSSFLSYYLCHFNVTVQIYKCPINTYIMKCLTFFYSISPIYIIIIYALSVSMLCLSKSMFVFHGHDIFVTHLRSINMPSSCFKLLLTRMSSSAKQRLQGNFILMLITFVCHSKFLNITSLGRVNSFGDITLPPVWFTFLSEVCWPSWLYISVGS